MSNDILVIGSMNMDLVVQTPRAPKKGETIMGNKFSQIPGGKGANQALAAGKLGGEVNFIGCCGQDAFGDELLESLKTGGVNIDDVLRVEGSSGVANITIEDDGDNRIIVVAGANSKVTPEVIESFKAKIKAAKILLLQLEIPLESVSKAIEFANKYDTTVILDPAPAVKLPEELYSMIDYLLPNEGELDLLLEDYEVNTLQKKIELLLDLGVKRILLTQGGDGVTLYSKGKEESYAALKVEVVDTTAAGDSFAGAFAYGLQRGFDEAEAIRYANSVAALAVTKLGAQSSLPTKEEVDKFQKERGL
ncbi:ribokinase [Orenia metallireducens]|uniref:Ribokinase n=1 Tax=Orenia metallireducens TaxID=1413210 RepID=A0A285H9D5_9FIRM|nr:ribokinase [Orenia metallireducens]PRX28889.1 ribokinase [Orenia metallireducens]SNY32362.1 ribokinase [Orenia metallireducens]